MTCDMAEYYHILDWEELPVQKLAALVSGLPPYSRSKKQMSGQEYDNQTLLMAMLLDGVNTIAWMMSEDGHAGKNRPKSIYQNLVGNEPEKEIQAYLSAEDFEAARNEILRRGGFIND